MRTFPCLLTTMAIGFGTLGCRGVGLPNWLHPGPAGYQQAAAERFDPYPEDEPAPAIVGARPREYQKAPAEPSRSRWLPWSWTGR